MKLTVQLIVFLFLSNSAFAQLWLVDPLEPIYPDKNELKEDLDLRQDFNKRSKNKKTRRLTKM